MNGKQITCSRCNGKGVVASRTFDGPMPDECPDCGGSGLNWQYESGAIAKYYTGPFLSGPSKSKPRVAANPESNT